MARVIPGSTLEICAVAGVQPQPAHRVGKQLRVDALGPSAAVFVGLDFHQRGLGSTREPRDRPRVRVCFLELVGRPVHNVLHELLKGRLALRVSRQRWAGVLADETLDLGPDRHRGDRRNRNKGAQRRLELGLEHHRNISTSGLHSIRSSIPWTPA